MSCEPEEVVDCKNLGDAIAYILDVFEDYADEETGKICQEEFEKLLSAELPDGDCKAKIDEFGLDKILSKLDKKEDGVDIKEFSRLIKFLITGQLCRNNKREKGKGRRKRRGKGKGGRCQEKDSE